MTLVGSDGGAVKVDDEVFGISEDASNAPATPTLLMTDLPILTEQERDIIRLRSRWKRRCEW